MKSEGRTNTDHTRTALELAHLLAQAARTPWGEVVGEAHRSTAIHAASQVDRLATELCEEVKRALVHQAGTLEVELHHSDRHDEGVPVELERLLGEYVRACAYQARLETLFQVELIRGIAGLPSSSPYLMGT